ncbi:rhomboid family intramembrane serine protease [Granulosicoccaceae sp. 1_MG-2023]|nr:rhomboid family intramembrane serine protease [Granulosicoccaceae sp. 1_MG-2023]
MPDLNRLLRESPATVILIAINLLIFLAQMSTGDSLTRLGVLYGPAVQDGQWIRLLSSGFMHASLIHIAFNMALLYMLGSQLEQGFGSLRFLLLYFGALFGGDLAVMLFNWTQPTLGASGAVLGLAGAFALALHQRGINPRQSPVFGLVILNLGLPLLMPGVSFWGHFGGVVAGVVMAYLVIWLPARARSGGQNAALSLGAAGLAGFAVLSVMAAMAGGLTG